MKTLQHYGSQVDIMMYCIRVHVAFDLFINFICILHSIQRYVTWEFKSGEFSFWGFNDSNISDKKYDFRGWLGMGFPILLVEYIGKTITIREKRCCDVCKPISMLPPGGSGCIISLRAQNSCVDLPEQRQAVIKLYFSKLYH